jgi:hypothetical protein
MFNGYIIFLLLYVLNNIMTDTENNFAKFTVYDGLMVHVEFGERSPTFDEFNDQFLNGLKSVLDNGQPFTLFVDASKLGTVPMSIALHVIKWMKTNRPQIQTTMKASAIIVGSEFILGLLDWVFTLSPPVSPNKIVTDASEGFQFIRNYMNTVNPATIDIA